MPNMQYFNTQLQQIVEIRCTKNSRYRFTLRLLYHNSIYSKSHIVSYCFVLFFIKLEKKNLSLSCLIEGEGRKLNYILKQSLHDFFLIQFAVNCRKCYKTETKCCSFSTNSCRHLLWLNQSQHLLRNYNICCSLQFYQKNKEIYLVST